MIQIQTRFENIDWTYIVTSLSLFNKFVVGLISSPEFSLGILLRHLIVIIIYRYN